MNTKPKLIDAPLVAWSADLDPAIETARLLTLALPGNSATPVKDAFASLTALNARLETQGTREIREALSRQAVLAEAYALRFERAALSALDASKVQLAERLQGMAQRCRKGQLQALGALHQVIKDDRHD